MSIFNTDLNGAWDMIADLHRRVKALEAKAEPKEAGPVAGKWVLREDKTSMINTLTGEVKSINEPAPKVETFKELPDPIRCAYRTHNAINGFKAELIFNDENEYQTVRNLITRYNEGEIA